MKYLVPPKQIRGFHKLQKVDYQSINNEVVCCVKQKLRQFSPSKPEVTVAIIAHNEEKNLFGCLASLSESIVNFPVEFLVVNNASTDGTERIVKDLGLKVVNENKKGYGFARQRGLEEARGKIVITGDADTLYSSGWINSMTKPLLNYDVKCTTSLHASLSEDDKYGLGLLVYQYIKLGTWLLKQRKRPHLNCGGASMAFRKSDALLAGGYKVDGSRGEDGDLAYKLNKLGKIRLLTSRSALIYTSMRRVEADGSLFKAFLIRLRYRLKHLDSFLYADKNG